MRAVGEIVPRGEDQRIVHEDLQALVDRGVAGARRGLVRRPAQPPAVVANAGGMRSQLSRRHLLQVGRQVGSDLADRLIEIDETALHESGKEDRGHRLRHGTQTHRGLCGHGDSLADVGIAVGFAPGDPARGADTHRESGGAGPRHPLSHGQSGLLDLGPSWSRSCRASGGITGKPVPSRHLDGQRYQG